MPNSQSQLEKTHKRYAPVVINYTSAVQPRLFYERRHITLYSGSVLTKTGWRKYPICTLQGKWMDKAGFTPGQTVEVKVYHKKLIISVIREREENFPGTRS